MGVVLGLPRGADGWYVLELIALAGWSVTVVGNDAGGVDVSATRGTVRLERSGAEVVDVVLDLFEDVRRTRAVAS